MPKKTILYIMHINWHWIKQRPQFLAENLSSFYAIRVIYVISVRDLFKINAVPQYCHGIYQLPFGRNRIIKILNRYIFRIIVNKFITKYDIIWFTNPVQFVTVASLIDSSRHVVYDCMDDILEFPHNKSDLSLSASIKLYEESLIKRSDILFFSSAHLKNTILNRYNILKRFKVVNNGIDSSILHKFSSKMSSAQDCDYCDIYYVGTISKWFDFNSLILILDKFPSVRFTLIGPSDVVIPYHERLVIQGVVLHSSLPDFLCNAAALIMPFIITDLILSVNPVKLYEYIAVGCPVITCQYEEVNKFHEFVHSYSNISELEVLISKLLLCELEVKSKEIRFEFLKENTWSQRAETIRAELNI